MNLSREFTQEVDGKAIHFKATYNPATHTFRIEENSESIYEFVYNMASKEWKAIGDPQPSVSVDQLAIWVQESFGIFV